VMGGFPNMIERVCNVMIPNVNKMVPNGMGRVTTVTGGVPIPNVIGMFPNVTGRVPMVTGGFF